MTEERHPLIVDFDAIGPKRERSVFGERQLVLRGSNGNYLITLNLGCAWVLECVEKLGDPDYFIRFEGRAAIDTVTWIRAAFESVPNDLTAIALLGAAAFVPEARWEIV